MFEKCADYAGKSNDVAGKSQAGLSCRKLLQREGVEAVTLSVHSTFQGSHAYIYSSGGMSDCDDAQVRKQMIGKHDVKSFGFDIAFVETEHGITLWARKKRSSENEHDQDSQELVVSYEILLEL